MQTIVATLRVAMLCTLGMVGVVLPARSDAVSCRLDRMDFARAKSTIAVSHFSIELQNPDSSGNPQAWEGPVSIHDTATDRTCSVATQGLIDRPLLAFGDRYLALVTFSGSNFRVETLDLAACKAIAATKEVSGPIRLQQGRVLAGTEALADLPCAKFE